MGGEAVGRAADVVEDGWLWCLRRGGVLSDDGFDGGGAAGLAGDVVEDGWLWRW